MTPIKLLLSEATSWSPGPGLEYVGPVSMKESGKRDWNLSVWQCSSCLQQSTLLSDWSTQTDTHLWLVETVKNWSLIGCLRQWIKCSDLIVVTMLIKLLHNLLLVTLVSCSHSQPQSAVEVFTGDDAVSGVMVRSGDSVTLPCSGGEEWFFCLWRHPSGGKECSVQVRQDNISNNFNNTEKQE